MSVIRMVSCLPLVAAVCEAVLPVPPQQNTPWKLPSDTGTPDYVVRVAARLFEVGLADPRGGSYRDVEIVFGHGDKAILETHAWVFSQEYAVCWDGLVYTVHRVGGPTNLDQDVDAIVKADAWKRIPFGREPTSNPAPFWTSLHRAQLMAPASIALLLRFGRPDLAAKLWNTSEVPDPFGQAGQHEPDEGRWLSTSAEAWFATAYWRLTEAFAGEEAQEATDVGESLVTWISRVPDSWLVENRWVPHHVPDISFAKPAPAILADARRRLHRPLRPKIDLAAVEAGGGNYAELRAKPQSARIADLVDRLDEVHGSKISFPGPLVFAWDPIYKLLVQEGEAAVDALLDAYENDRRLTPTFDYSRPWSTNYTPISVHEVAGMILGDILGIHASAPADLRAWWHQHHSADRALHAFEVLSDDQATPEQWLEAADFLTLPDGAWWSNGVMSGGDRICDPKPDLSKLNGDELRNRKDPSVSDLLARRASRLVGLQPELACKMSVKASLWDLPAALPALRIALAVESCRTDSLVTLARLSVGDALASSDWADGIRKRAASRAFQGNDLAPLWMFREDAVLQKAAELLFTQADSPLSPARRPDLVHSPLLNVPAYRQSVLSALSNAAVIGTATRTPDGSLSFNLKDGSGGGGGPSKSGHDPREIPPGQKRPIRVKDLVAWNLTAIEGAPQLELDWPDADRDAAVDEIAAFLKAHADELRAFPARLRDTACPVGSVYLKQQ